MPSNENNYNIMQKFYFFFFNLMWVKVLEFLSPAANVKLEIHKYM